MRPPLLELESHTALGTLPRPLNVTKDRWSVPSRVKATSGAKHFGSSPFGAGIGVCDQVAPPSEEKCRAQEKNGVSIRFATARFARRTGLRTSVGELCALMSRALVAPMLTGASRPTR